VRETVAGGKIGVEQRTTAAGRAPAAVPGEAAAAWVDLLDPTPEQDRELLARLGVDIPTREEMEEIESSSRAYEEGGVAYLTALVLCRSDTDHPGATPVSFVLTPIHLVTVRFADLTPFRAFAARCARRPENAENSAAAFAGLIEAIVDRTADVLERADAELAKVSAEVFRPDKTGTAAGAGRPRRRTPRDLDELVERIGRHHDLLSTVRESLLTLQRVVSFARQAADGWMPEEGRAQLATAERDLHSLMEHDGHLTQKAGFLLDATLGLINTQQN
jgi:magnesium transporter